MNITSLQRGAGLIEVMVTVLILSTSLLGLAALQNRSLQYNHSAYLRSQANILAYDLLDRIRINRENFAAYNVAIDSDPTAGGTAGTDLNEWRGSLAAALPNGGGAVSCAVGTEKCTVTIQWDERDGAAAASDGDPDPDAPVTTTTFKYTTRI